MKKTLPPFGGLWGTIMTRTSCHLASGEVVIYLTCLSFAPRWGFSRHRLAKFQIRKYKFKIPTQKTDGQSQSTKNPPLKLRRERFLCSLLGINYLGALPCAQTLYFLLRTRSHRENYSVSKNLLDFYIQQLWLDPAYSW